MYTALFKNRSNTPKQGYPTNVNTGMTPDKLKIMQPKNTIMR